MNRIQYSNLFIFAAIILLSTRLQSQVNGLPEISNRGTMVKDSEGKDLVGVSGMAHCEGFLFFVCEAQPGNLYYGDLASMGKKAMQSLTGNSIQTRTIPVKYKKDIEVPLLGAGRGFEAIEFMRTENNIRIFLSYEADFNHYLYAGILKLEGGIPTSAEISQKYNLPENPEDAVHNAGWEAIAYDPESEELTGIFENRLGVEKLAFRVNATQIPETIQLNLAPVRIEYRVTDMTCVSAGIYLASVYIWKETYQNLAGDQIRAQTPRFRILRINRENGQDGKVSLNPVILKSFPEIDYFLGDVYLNFEGITAVHEDELREGILLVNDNDPPYIKFGRRGVPPSVLRFLLPAEYNGNLK